MADPQLKHAAVSLHVVNTANGAVLFTDNAAMGLAPASTQKLITAATAYELLGANFRYKTVFEWDNARKRIAVQPSGDPTLGSWRWPATREEYIFEQMMKIQIDAKANVVVDAAINDAGMVPDGWIWEDVGNYYGAGPHHFNWRENQFDLFLQSGSRIGDTVRITGAAPFWAARSLRSEATAAAAGTGDNAFIYYPMQQPYGVVKGTIPVNQQKFSISGSIQFPALFFTEAYTRYAVENKNAGNTTTAADYVHYSPPLDSIVFWFNRRSINLYGEALLWTIGEQKRVRSTEAGVAVLQDFWKERGITAQELNIVDGSGLSPLNRVTTRAQVAVLLHAAKQLWYKGFYASLPTFNGINMKSGTIRGVKGFTGYVQSKTGERYAFSFLVNNFNGSASAVVQKMYAVLDVLK